MLGLQTIPPQIVHTQVFSRGPGFATMVLCIIVGICIYAGLNHMLIWLLQRRQRMHRSFALLCLTAGTNAFLAIVGYQATEVAEYLFAVTWQVNSVLVFCVAFVWFIMTYTRVQAKPFLWAIVLLTAVQLIANNLLPCGILYSKVISMRRVVLPWGEAVAAIETVASPWQFLLLTTNCMLTAFAFFACYRQYRQGQRRPAMILAAALVLFVCTTFFDFLVAHAVVDFIYVAEFGFVTLVAAMSLCLSIDLAERSKKLEAANLGLRAEIDGRRHAEEELARSEQLHRGAIEAAGAVPYYRSFDPDEYRSIGPGIEAMTGYSREELTFDLWTKMCQETIPQGELAGLSPEEAERKARSEPGIDWRAEFRIIDRSGHERWIFNAASHLWDGDGKLLGTFGILQDVTESKRLAEQLRQSQKMEAIGQLAGGVAHDFNNLLQAILGYTDLALRKLAPDDPVRSELEQVRRAADRARTLTRQLLTFSRRQVIRPVPLDINDTIGGILGMLRRLIGEHIQLDFTPGRLSGVVHADKGQVEQVLMNLCVNARDAMPNGGKLCIETSSMTVDQEFVRTHEWAIEGEHVLVSVTDSGCGMSKQTLAQVFDPFFTTKDTGEGTGLGLSTVYGIVKQHGGMVHAYSELGKGTIFKVYFPVFEGSAAQPSAEDAGPVRGGTETILLAEDEEMILQLAERVLGDAGYTVLTARNGVEALSVFEAHADEIDLALLDVVMPKMGGGEVREAILARRPEVRFLYASGYSANAIHTDFVLDEGIQLIQKPYPADDLLRKVRQALDE